jgi:hypothetical protein
LIGGGQERGYRVKHHDPRKTRLVLLVSVAGLAAAGWGLFRLGFSMSGFAEQGALEEQQRLEDRIAFLEDQNAMLTGQVASLQRGELIEREAAGDVTATLHEMESELLLLREELAFYKSIVSPSAMQPGLHVQSFELARGEDSGQYHYKLVLTQVRGNTRVARGDVDIEVTGLLDGRLERMRLGQLTGQGEDLLKFSFKYFQSVEGVIVLPRGFEPTRVAVRVKPKSKRLEAVEREYEWDSALAGDQA